MHGHADFPSPCHLPVLYRPTDEDRNYEPGMHLPVQASLRYVGPIHKAPTEFVPDSYPKAWEIPAFLESSGFFRATDADVLHFAATCQRVRLHYGVPLLPLHIVCCVR